MCIRDRSSTEAKTAPLLINSLSKTSPANLTLAPWSRNLFALLVATSPVPVSYTHLSTAQSRAYNCRRTS